MNARQRIEANIAAMAGTDGAAANGSENCDADENSDDSHRVRAELGVPAGLAGTGFATIAKAILGAPSEISDARTTVQNSDTPAVAVNPADSTGVSTGPDDPDLESIDFAGLLEVLNYTDAEQTALTVKRYGQETSQVLGRDDAIVTAAKWLHRDLWYNLNPTVCTRGNGARGTSAEVSRLAALPLDGDDKNMGRGGIDQVVAEITALIGPPSAIVESGHGRQFLWPVHRGDAEALTNAQAAALGARFGLLITKLASARRGKVDNVSRSAADAEGSRQRQPERSTEPQTGHRATGSPR